MIEKHSFFNRSLIFSTVSFFFYSPIVTECILFSLTAFITLTVLCFIYISLIEVFTPKKNVDPTFIIRSFNPSYSLIVAKRKTNSETQFKYDILSYEWTVCCFVKRREESFTLRKFVDVKPPVTSCSPNS